jgi:transposase InsO family protein
MPGRSSATQQWRDAVLEAINRSDVDDALRRRTVQRLPQVLRTDNGPEFLGEAFVQWAKANGMAIRCIQPGKPNQNAYIERFNRTFREEVLDPYLFQRLDDVREAAHGWMIEYNEERPHDGWRVQL